MFPIEEIEKIAGLARLELTDEEKTMFSRQFEQILNYFKVIDSAPQPEADSSTGEDNSPSANPHFREDKAVDSGISPREFSPHMEDGHFKVPKVIE